MTAVDACTVDHQAAKRDEAAWSQLDPLEGARSPFMPTYNDEPGAATHLELKNCPSCKTTLCREVWR